MPFARYLQHRSIEEQESSVADNDQLQFQIPSFMYSAGPPMLALGGGAEVLPFNSTWFTNNGFSQLPSSSPQSSLPIINTTPSPLGLPVYSASGFDVLSILSRIASRPNPRVVLGPVDMTCSFVVVDIRRYDHPIVYCSPTFCRLTGYQEHEILGRNCRFLQAPGGAVKRGEPRRFTSQDSVNILNKALNADKEVQTSILNYRKDGSAFLNLISVIPIPGGVNGAHHEPDNVVYHVGFQVDLSQQPNAIIDRLKEGAYMQNNSNKLRSFHPSLPPPTLHEIPPPLHRKAYVVPSLTMSPILASLIKSSAFLRSLPISTSTNSHPSNVVGTQQNNSSNNNPLSLLLLEYSPDFMHVVSLKGAFLYVAPSVTQVLGYLPSDLVGKSMADLAHPEDVVPLERQLKESSILLPSPSMAAPLEDPLPPNQVQARIIDVLFRARTKKGVYVWVECRGRLHVEPGKGRKAIILSARARAMPMISWGDIMRASGGLVPSEPRDGNSDGGGAVGINEREAAGGGGGGGGDMEFWAMLSGKGHSAGALVGVGASARDVLGYSPEELMGRRIVTFIVGEDAVEAVKEALVDDPHIPTSSNRNGKGRQRGAATATTTAAAAEESQQPPVKTTRIWCQLRTKNGGIVQVVMVLYRSGRGGLEPNLKVAPAPVLLQVRMLADTPLTSTTPLPNHVMHPLDANVFRELEVSRGSSWQYELQQLRFANRRLKEEVEALEAGTAMRASYEQNQIQQEAPLLVSTARSHSSPLDTSTTDHHHHRFPDFIPTSLSISSSHSPLSNGGIFSDLSSSSSSSISSLGNMNVSHSNPSSMAYQDQGLDHSLMPAPPTLPQRRYRRLPHRSITPSVVSMPPSSQPQPQPQPQPQQQQMLPSSGGLSVTPQHQLELQQVYAPVPRGTLSSSSLIQAMNNDWDVSRHFLQQPPAPALAALSSSSSSNSDNNNNDFNDVPETRYYNHQTQPLRLLKDWAPTPSMSSSTTNSQAGGVKRRLGR